MSTTGSVCWSKTAHRDSIAAPPGLCSTSLCRPCAWLRPSRTMVSTPHNPNATAHTLYAGRLGQANESRQIQVNCGYGGPHGAATH